MEAPPRSSAALPLPPPPPRPPPVQASSPATDRWGVDGARADSARVKPLRDYRRTRGLCFKCGERWGHDHTCPTTVQLHVVEELLELFGVDSVADSSIANQDQDTETVCAISKQALTGESSMRAFQLHAWIQGREVLMLVDSGSSTSFINQVLAEKLEGVQQMQQNCRVKVADGGELSWSRMIPNCNWASQGHEFCTDMWVLPLGMYDAIFGMDWLEAHSPMTVDWIAKIAIISTATGSVQLQGHPTTAVSPEINSA